MNAFTLATLNKAIDDSQAIGGAVFQSILDGNTSAEGRAYLTTSIEITERLISFVNNNEITFENWLSLYKEMTISKMAEVIPGMLPIVEVLRESLNHEDVLREYFAQIVVPMTAMQEGVEFLEMGITGCKALLKEMFPLH